MTVGRLAETAGWEVLSPGRPEAEVTDGYVSDLLSDVMAHAPAGGLLVTIHGHVNTIAVAALTALRAVVICHNRPVEASALEAARREGIAVFRTARNQYRTAIQVHGLLDAP